MMDGEALNTCMSIETWHMYSDMTAVTGLYVSIYLFSFVKGTNM